MSGETEHPFYFGEDAAIFGVLHRPETALARGPGWVLCSAFGVERNNSHRLMVEWARELCRLGYPVLRFDYRGTGDSAGTFDQFTVDDHLQDILAAMREMKCLTGRDCGGLLGLRLGASLAALAAARAGGVELLALWEPIIDGRAYRDQLLRITLANELVAGGTSHHSREELRGELAAGGSVHVDGFPLTAAMYESLAAVEPARLGRGAVRHALVVQVDAVPGHAPRRTMEDLCTAICAGGRGHLESAAAPIAWLRTKQFQWQPPELFGKTAAWIERTSGPGPEAFHLPVFEPRSAEAIRTTAHGRVVEKPVSFSVEGQQVWGILHRPEGSASGKPGVVMLAAGETCRSAIFYPGLARRLAAAGWPVLRADPRGLGDSQGRIECASLTEVFVQIQGGRLVPDAAAAVDFLTGELGAASCILTGLCGGAVTAAYAAALDQRVAAIAPIELRLLWDRVPEAGGSQDGWGQLPWRERLSGRSGGRLLLIARRVLHRFRARIRSLRLAAAALRRRGPEGKCGRDGWFVEKIGEDANLRVIDALKRTLDRGVPVLCVFADGQHRRHLESALPGLLPVESAFGPRFSLQHLEGADHNFVMPGCPERLAEALLAWLNSPERPWART
jgi:exosortase A-associated hydrolase 2